MQAHPPFAGGCAQVSRDAPPPLPGGYKLGEKVFYTGANETASNGDKWVHGQQGEVVGPATGKERNTHVNVLFPGNKGNVECLLTTVRRLRAASAATPPPPAAPHTRRCPRPVRPHDSLCRGAPALTACAAARAAAHCPGAGGVVAEGVVRVGRFGGSATLSQHKYSEYSRSKHGISI